MLVFGIDIPLVEIILVFAVIIFILLVESLIVISLLIRQLNKTNKLSQLMETLSETLLAIKKAEIDELDKLKRR
ncbi:MAG: hypothetical protein AABW48_04840 [Nanoarchaeota archaeon]